MALVAINASDASDLWAQAWQLLAQGGSQRQNHTKGDSVEMLHVGASIQDPRGRWVLSRHPPINPAFALAEVIWILAGRDDVQFLTPWNRRYADYVGPAQRAFGAYGPRLRHFGGVDQLESAYLALLAKPNSRQVVLNLWRPSTDLPLDDGRPRADDIPCSVMSLLKIADGRLHWFQVMRSNDLVLGLPYNIIQWTTIQEILAGWLGVEMGEYAHHADSLHVYNRDQGAYDSRIYEPARNTDDLRLSYSSFQPVLGELEAAVERIAAAQASSVIADTVSGFTGPEAYLNWVRVIASERSRRLGFDAESWASQVSNPMLRMALEAWLRYHGGLNE